MDTDVINPADTGEIIRDLGENTQVIQPFEPGTITARRPEATDERVLAEPTRYIGRHRPDVVARRRQVTGTVADPEPTLVDPPAPIRPSLFRRLLVRKGGDPR